MNEVYTEEIMKVVKITSEFVYLESENRIIKVVNNMFTLKKNDKIIVKYRNGEYYSWRFCEENFLSCIDMDKTTDIKKSDFLELFDRYPKKKKKRNKK